MNILFTSWLMGVTSIASIAHSAPGVNDDIFHVVSPWTVSDEFYVKFTYHGVKRRTSPEGQDFICAAILKSPFFSTDNDVEFIDRTEKTRKKFVLHTGLSEKEWDMLRKPNELVNVSGFRYTVRETVFPCLAKHKKTKELKLYLISHEYDFNCWIKRSTRVMCPPVGGRFVFRYNESESGASLLAVAEDPACRREYYAIDLMHFNSLRGDLTAISKWGQKICEFSTRRKVRACAVGLNRDEVACPPLGNRIEPQCEKRELIFKYSSTYISRYGSCNFTFSEWVLGCKVELRTKKTATYYVSLGYEPYQFLIYHPEKGSNVSLLTHHFYSHIGDDRRIRRSH